MPNNDSELKHPANQESSQSLDDKLYIYAKVNPAPSAVLRQEEKIGDWIPIPKTGGRIYFVELTLEVDQECLHNLLDDLHCLLTAYFLTDFRPRDLIDFQILTSPKNRALVMEAMHVFGNSGIVDNPDLLVLEAGQNLITSPRVSDLSFFDSQTRNMQAYPWGELEKHYMYLKGHPDFLRKLMLIRESFMNFNVVFSLQTYVRETELIVGVVILVAALESLFLGDSKEEIRLRFSLVGAIIYERNLKDQDFDKERQNKSKLSFDEARELFKTLYDIRSDIAHGTLSTIMKPSNRYWNKLAKIFKVNLIGENTFPYRVGVYGLIMSLIQHHIILLVKNSKDDLKLGPDQILKFLKI